MADFNIALQIPFRQIPLTQGKFAIVDDEDYDRLSIFKWKSTKGYAIRTITIGKSINGKRQRKVIRMHNLIIQIPLGMFIDHINNNTLDNRKINLRICTNNQNQRNRRKLSKASSKYKGVCFAKYTKKWQASIEIRIDGKRNNIYLGQYYDEKDAAKAYNAAAIKYFGKFAKLNTF